MKRAALYVRVSTQEQKKHGISVDSQIHALKDYAKENGITIVGIYNDAGISARKKYTKRPALLELLEEAKHGNIDLVLFTKLDRWFRSVADYYEVQKILDENKVKWRAIWEDYETETSSGVFKVNIMLSVAQSEADRTSERIKSTNEYRRLRGDYVGSAPTGYIVKGKDLVIDDDMYESVKAFFDTYLTTFSMTKALEVAKEKGFHKPRSNVYKMIRSPAYHGDANGYKCQAYITPEQHKLILESINKNTRNTRVNNHDYIFTGLVYCGYCGGRMSGHSVVRINKDGTRRRYFKYCCEYSVGTAHQHKNLQIVEHKLEEIVLNKFESILKKTVSQTDIIKKENDIKKKIEKENGKLVRLTELYTDGDISKESYTEKRDTIKKEIEALKDQRPKEVVLPPSDWKTLYNDLDNTHKRAFWMSMLKSIVITNETKENPDITLN